MERSCPEAGFALECRLTSTTGCWALIIQIPFSRPR